MEDTIVIFTGKGSPSFARDGGSRAWKLNIARASGARYAVICHHKHSVYKDFDGEHGKAWLVAKVTGITPDIETAGRWLVRFDEYAEIDVPDFWDGSRNPIRYSKIDELPVNLEQLHWKHLADMDFEDDAAEGGDGPSVAGRIRLEVMRAQHEVATNLGLEPSEVEVIIRPKTV